MNKKTILKAAAAFVLTFVLTLVIGSCNQKANAKSKNKVEKTDAAEEQEETKNKKKTEATEGSRPLAGLSLYLQKAAERNVDVVKLLMERWQQELERREQLQKDINLTAEVIFWENWYTDKNKEAAYDTGAVAWNRVKSPKFPNTLEEVLYQKGQYSTTKYFFTQELPKECYEMAEDIVMNGTPDVPETVLFQATFKQGKVWKVINGEYFCFG